MDILQIASLLIVLAGVFGAINHFVLRLPSSIGILVVALLASLAMLGAEALIDGFTFAEKLRQDVRDLEFSETLLEGMLGLLLFAGGLHVKVEDLKAEAWSVALMATVGVAISTAIAGVGFSWITGAPILIALVFGALISPTDPVAVLGVLREADLRRSLEAKIAGESLFNDGVGYVLFLLLVGLAFPAGDAAHADSALDGILLFVQEAGGGALLGGVLGWVVFRIMRRIDDYPLEVLLSLGLALGGYQLAVALHVSGPIMAVVAGLLIGHVGMEHGMSERTRDYLQAFWILIDEILNAVLFLLIGIEVFAIHWQTEFLVAGAIGIVLSLVARLAAVAVPILLLRIIRQYPRDVIPIMTWGGLKGGISVALALSLPDGEWKPVVLTVTYMIVVFSIIVQGLTIAPLARRISHEPELL